MAVIGLNQAAANECAQISRFERRRRTLQQVGLPALSDVETLAAFMGPPAGGPRRVKSALPSFYSGDKAIGFGSGGLVARRPVRCPCHARYGDRADRDKMPPCAMSGIRVASSIPALYRRLDETDMMS